jgi:hypothetical protein
MNLRGRGAGRLGRAGRAPSEAGWAGLHRIWPEADFQLRIFFSFSNLFCKLQINLNFNDFYLHNKI